LYTYKFIDVADVNYDPSSRHRSNVILEQTISPRPSARFSHPGKAYNYCTAEDSSDEVIPIAFTGQPPFTLELDLKYSLSAAPESITKRNIQSSKYDFRIPAEYLRPGTSHITIRRVVDSRGCQSKVDTTTVPSRVQISVHDPPTIVPAESSEHFCIGDHISFLLSGVAPFTVYYDFQGSARKATVQGTTFRRVAERPGEFRITGISDSSSVCKFSTSLSKVIHPLPTVKLSQGLEKHTEIHEGGETEILFEFTGEPPFQFVYTRSENTRKGKKGTVLDSKTETIHDAYSARIRAGEEGTYEVISIKDKWCSVSKAVKDRKKGQ
jgi:nucleoporin POM152